ncbi:ThiF family adenylyltransferase [Pantoea stewartii]|uniref:ThiF family adenylyltransferase n=1 Tax=Pantoea stewartii TaxID=66269 RepID=UPI0021D4C8CB|nr:ThiF family adenylyltransferase [Pantoea stewartii]MCU7368979.1 ThiF family adenylyltransferase [Pantoea stewartii]
MTIHNLFLHSGFQFSESRSITDLPITLCGDWDVYIKNYLTKEGYFTVAVIDPDEDFSHLPEVYILSRPEKFVGKTLPHISSFQRLCLVNQDTADWNPQHPPVVIEMLDHLIQQALNNAVSDGELRQIEFQGEFVNYWDGITNAYVYGNVGELLGEVFSYRVLEAITSSAGQVSKEIVIFTDSQQKEDWYRLRKQELTLDKDNNVTVVRVAHNDLAPVKWPPESLSQVFDWLKSVDLSAHDSLARGILKNLTKDRQVVLLDIANEGIIGFEIKFQSGARTVLQHHAPKKTKHNGKKNGKKLRSVIPMLRAKHATNAILRLSVRSVSRQEIHQRNRIAPLDLENKKILIIGCGTIGGFTVQLLAKVGSGRGKMGKLTLFDGDFLSPHNLSRHALPATYIGWNKSEALREYIIRDALGHLNIHAVPHRFEMKAENIRGYDIVIDATGHAPTGKMLSHLVRSLPRRPPFLIHGYNDAYGMASVVMIDDGKACYGCTQQLTLLSESNKPSSAHRNSCGSVFTPYDASVSTITAALIHEAVLNTLNEKLPWTYAQHSTGKVIHHRRRKLEKYGGCSVCS